MQWCGSDELLRKIPTRLRGTNFCTSSARFAPSFVSQPNGPECTQIVQIAKNVSLWSNGVIGCVCCEKFRCDFVARIFALVRPVLHRVCKTTKRSQMHLNSMKRKKNVSLGSNGVDRVRLLRIILTRLRGTNFCTSSACFAPSFVRQPNGPECMQIERNAPKRLLRVQWGGSGAFVAKKSDATSRHEFLH